MTLLCCDNVVLWHCCVVTLLCWDTCVVTLLCCDNVVLGHCCVVTLLCCRKWAIYVCGTVKRVFKNIKTKSQIVFQNVMTILSLLNGSNIWTSGVRDSVGDVRNAYKILIGNPERKKYLGNVVVQRDCYYNIPSMSKIRMWTGFKWLESNDGMLWWRTLVFCESTVILISEQLPASRRILLSYTAGLYLLFNKERRQQED